MPSYQIGSAKAEYNADGFKRRETLITQFKNRFSTYGYEQIRTSTFESYDLYSKLTGTVNKDDMVKVIDSSGKVLVMRPDVTIPITRMVAEGGMPEEELRYFYIQDVFRSTASTGTKESTQAGVECLGNNRPETDAEVIMLAIHNLKELGFSNFKIEIGHAGFFKSLIAPAGLNPSEIEQLQSLIQSKNIVEMVPFLEQLSLTEDLREAMQAIPMLYGTPREVMQQISDKLLNEEMHKNLNNLSEIVDILEDYEVGEHIVLNLGLINNMNYYSDIIFQGFVEQVGHPLLMGGRYNHLGDQYGVDLPAIGFAMEVDLLQEALVQKGQISEVTMVPQLIMTYEKSKQKEAFQTAQFLREDGFTVRIFPESSAVTQKPIDIKITLSESVNTITTEEDTQTFRNYQALLDILKQNGGK
ncbi:ATP phosphoribosyltransferase regulatory subunit [Oceanobacillus picturae]|uniref:ATP phosphoribosyltransferase regulatory subunit n=1 Tax=Oceanobacillus picturae TaxID=171693 RepID=W9AMA5_9BACI|nr:ATP phosphoribosyltransferase regulatory subunit [Oceanobacillus picturae]RIU88557.1 ATP phosphoribosyltransferase regulatory subunit [Oceanobacillus picturae]CDO04037.1 ATP phosphoribosyltransferase regulatory subunit [Oceanobacillus picturae]